MTVFPELALRRRVAEEAALAAGEVHLRYYGQAIERQSKASRNDYVTRADLEAQEAVQQVIAKHFLSEPVIGEEDPDALDRLPPLLNSGCWLTDPLDGTGDFVHTGTAFASVVSYVHEERPLACALYFPALKELFSAAAGQGARLKGERTTVSAVTQLSDALLATSYNAPTPERARFFADRIASVMPHVGGLRMTGASSQGAASVAAGRFDIYVTMAEPVGVRPLAGRQQKPQPWETPAYTLLVQEAGGVVSAHDGGPATTLGFNTYAANRELIEAYLAVVKDDQDSG